MTRLFMKDPITIRELTNLELKVEALRQRDNLTLELYRITVDRGGQEEALYVGDERMAIVTWEGSAYLCEDIGSAGEALDHVLAEIEG